MPNCEKCDYGTGIGDCIRNEVKNPNTGEYKENCTDRSINRTGDCTYFKKKPWWAFGSSREPN